MAALTSIEIADLECGSRITLKPRSVENKQSSTSLVGSGEGFILPDSGIEPPLNVATASIRLSPIEGSEDVFTQASHDQNPFFRTSSAWYRVSRAQST